MKKNNIPRKQTSSTASIVSIEHLSKSFGHKKVLSDISFTLEEPAIYALLGRNGSGKTTLLNLLTCRYFPDHGKIQIFGEEPYDNIPVLSDICYMRDHLAGFSELRLKRILSYAKTFYPNWDDGMMNRCLSLFHLNEKEIYSNLSKGMQSAVSITIGLSARTRLTLFDEIHTGLDASIRQDFYKLLLEDYMEHPRTFVLSTHLIDEMENLFSHVLMLKDNQLILQESLESIQEKSFELTSNTTFPPFVMEKHILSSSEFLSTKKLLIFDTLTAFEKQQLQKKNITISHLSLQELFITLTKEETR